ncbi:hypothetical protein SORBI_3001G027500 [Sorghum bicolor]|uniref:Uncharacterized protein n=1 Tax=Sorghum bicolor TaxID=4558 RepID=C5WU26_SORBI|nr:hypothetical protein SORBI_3001G027500 [Sorghum bicolor]
MESLERPKYECLLFDYMRHHLHIEESHIADICLDLCKEFGTTMASLKVLGYKFDSDEFHAAVHDGFRPISPILCKPSIEAIIWIANVDPKKTIFFDDSALNIASGKLQTSIL